MVSRSHGVDEPGGPGPEPPGVQLGGADPGQVAELVLWLGTAAAAGVIGNTADRWVRRATRLRHRWRLVPVPDLTADGAVELATAALHLDGRVAGRTVTEAEATRDPRGRWLVTLHLEPDTVYRVRIPRYGHRSGAVRVTVARM